MLSHHKEYEIIPSCELKGNLCRDHTDMSKADGKIVLNFDILTDIMDATEDRRTLLNLMGTRRSLNAIGARIIVRNPLDFSDLEPSSTDSFVKFMGRHQSLFKHIKDISIHVSSRDGDPSSTTLLLSLLDHATRLVDLKLQMLIPSFVDFTSPLSLSSLQHLVLNDLHTAARC
ncbi:hypothetical protein ABKN59_001399 [Abortiporus biennis]